MFLLATGEMMRYEFATGSLTHDSSQGYNEGLTLFYRDLFFMSSLITNPSTVDDDSCFWVASCSSEKACDECVDPLTDLLPGEKLTYVVLKRQLAVFATDQGKLMFYNHDRSAEDKLVVKGFHFSNPDFMINLKKPIVRFDLGFKDEKIFVCILTKGPNNNLTVFSFSAN
jgi:hypothetical protein